MVSGDGACLRIDGVVVADNESVDREGILLCGNFLGKCRDALFHGTDVRRVD